MTASNYNRIYVIGRVCLQVSLSSDWRVIDLLPQLTATVGGKLLSVGASVSWVYGMVALGIMNQGFALQERNRREKLKDTAQRLGVTEKVAAYRYHWC